MWLEEKGLKRSRTIPEEDLRGRNKTPKSLILNVPVVPPSMLIMLPRLLLDEPARLVGCEPAKKFPAMELESLMKINDQTNEPIQFNPPPAFAW